MADSNVYSHETRSKSPWKASAWTVILTLLGLTVAFGMWESFTTRQLDAKGCEMSYMWPSYTKYEEFDTEHTRFASKYSLYIYREGNLDEDTRVKGVPVLFIPGNAGSYKQVRSFAAEAAYHYHNTYGYDPRLNRPTKRALDFFSVDFNEDFTAFHGQTLLDQAEYLNDAIAFILSLYHTPSRTMRDGHLPDPTSVIIVGHSMGGVVARTMFTMPNYRFNTINTIITLAAPHARAPVSFDGDVVRTYQGVNEYWRQAYSMPAASNPLHHVTLISIAGGGLDTIVPSDYAAVTSIMPETHGFTVFGSTVPRVWTGMDHLAITWCDQLRKAVIRALYEVIDVTAQTQTIPWSERMRSFKKWFLTGLEETVERDLSTQVDASVLTLTKETTVMINSDKFILRNIGQLGSDMKVHLLTIPRSASGPTAFHFLSNGALAPPETGNALTVLLCTAPSRHVKSLPELFPSHAASADGESTSHVKMTCQNVQNDIVKLPASTKESSEPFTTNEQPFSYFSYDTGSLSSFDFVAILDKPSIHGRGWTYAEFRNTSDSLRASDSSLLGVVTKGLTIELPRDRPIVTTLAVPAIRTSLLAYNVRVEQPQCRDTELFRPLLRQYIDNVLESKFFVNVSEAKVNIHGVAPYVPAPYFERERVQGLALQLWSDPTCGDSVVVRLSVDILGSLGKLWMRYRIFFAAMPLLLVTLTMRKQFQIYDEAGAYISFLESLAICLRSAIPSSIAALVLLSIGLPPLRRHWTPLINASGNSSRQDRRQDASHEILLGFEEPMFSVLIVLFSLVCLAACVVVDYVGLAVIQLLSLSHRLFVRNEENVATTAKSLSAATNPRARVLATCILLALVSTVIPYHLAYVVLCLVQLATCVRSCTLASMSRSQLDRSFSNYTHSIFILMLWILPINLPVLVVWIRNLSIQWLTPFSAHHNILAIVPCLLLVETVSLGHMIPRVQSGLSPITGLFLFAIGAYAAMYGVSYAYVLPHLVNIFFAWLVVLHLGGERVPAGALHGQKVEASLEGDEVKKIP